MLPSIVSKFFDGTREKTLQLIQFSQELQETGISNKCFMIDAILNELVHNNLLESEQAMHLWAHAIYVLKETNRPFVGPSLKKLQSAINKLSQNKDTFFEHYKMYLEDPDTNKIRALHQSNRQLRSIVSDFVSYYYDGDLVKAQTLLTASRQISRYSAVGRILMRLHEEMAKRNQLSNFEVVRIFNDVRNRTRMNLEENLMSPQFGRSFQLLQEKVPTCLRQLLWPEGASKFHLVNKYFNTTLCAQAVNNTFICACSHQQPDTVWRIIVDPDTALLTIAYVLNSLELAVGSDLSVCLGQTGMKWMVNVIDQHHLKIYCDAGKDNLAICVRKILKRCVSGFLTAEGIFTEVANYQSVHLRRENSTHMQLWKLQPST